MLTRLAIAIHGVGRKGAGFRNGVVDASAVLTSVVSLDRIYASFDGDDDLREVDMSRRQCTYSYKDGDANVRSVWLCSRNDAIGNLAVILAAAGVFGTGSALPDLVVALVMSGLALWSGLVIVAHARRDIGDARQVHQKG